MINRLPWVSWRACFECLSSVWAPCHRALRYWVLLRSGKHLIWAKDGVEVAMERGKKQESALDFVVRFREPGKQWRTPKHIHLIVELYVKEAYDKELTHRLRDHLLQVFEAVHPIDSYPPKLQFFKPEHALLFQSLDAVGEMSVEFLLVVSELIFIQEKTNYQGGSLTYKLYQDFGVKDRFTVVNTATLEKQR
jgi:hypothetical protein